MRALAPWIVGERTRRGTARRLLVSGVAAATVVLVTASTPAAREAGGNPPPGTVSFGVAASGVAAVAAPPPQLPPVSVGQARVKYSKGTPKLPPSAFDHLDIPETALFAYQRAAFVVGQVDQSCGLTWTLLAAIGRVESDHGRYGGARLRSDGTSSPVIRGVALDGTGPVARIRDTDGGRLDGDPVWDRAVGPMQFLPSTWSVVGVDADGDSVRSPDDINDAALATAVFLCGTAGDLTTRSGLRSAILRYNPSSSYVASVVALDRAYRANEAFTLVGLGLGGSGGILTLLAPGGGRGVAVRSGGTPAVPPGTSRADHPHATRAGSAPGRPGQHGQHAAAPPSAGPGAADTPGSDPTGTADPGTAGTPDPAATGTPDPGTADPPDAGPTGTPDPTPDPAPTPTPAPTPVPVRLTGVLAACGDGWCLDQLTLDVGDAAFLAATSSADFDGDGVVESNSDELTGLAGTEVSVLAAPDTTPARVLDINDVAYAGG